MNIIDEVPFDELVSLINSLSDEKSKRILLSKAADVYGKGGKANIIELTGITYPTLIAGNADSKNDAVICSNRIRREGAGRKSTTETCPNITEAIEKIIDGNTYGDLSKELHWVASALSLRKISDILEADYSITVSHVKISQLLTDMGYSKQVNQKMEQVGIPSPDRNEQFEFIDHTAHEYLENGEPVISVDTKKRKHWQFQKCWCTSAVLVCLTSSASPSVSAGYCFQTRNPCKALYLSLSPMKRFVKCLFELLTQTPHSVPWKRSGVRGQSHRKTYRPPPQ